MENKEKDLEKEKEKEKQVKKFKLVEALQSGKTVNPEGEKAAKEKIKKEGRYSIFKKD